jgi:hypothetical protein
LGDASVIPGFIMPPRLAVALAAALLLPGLAEVRGQVAPPVAPPVAQKPPCFDEFMALRGDVEKRFATATGGIQRKAPAAELCQSFTQFMEAINKMVKYVEENNAKCGFPPEVLPNIKANQSKSQDYRKQACAAAASQAPRKPAAPSLSDALGAPVPDANTTRTGRGTLDSLSGNPIGR